MGDYSQLSTFSLMHTTAYIGTGLQIKGFLVYCRSHMQGLAGCYRRWLCRIAAFSIPFLLARPV